MSGYHTAMSETQLGIVIGGLVPALLFGVAGICQKLSNQHGISTGAYVLSVGIGVVLVGIALCLWNTSQTANVKSIIPAIVMGLSWGSGSVLVAIAINNYKTPLSVLAPLYNMNTLVAVVGALFIFSEWKDVNALRLILGSLLIIGGGVLVSS
jgi:transporter family protein